MATSAKAAGASRCSALLAGLDCSAHKAWKTCAASEPSSGTAQIAVFHAGGLASSSSNPRTSAREHRGESDRFGSSEGVPDDDVRARLASRSAAGVEVGGLRREGLRGWWRVACAKAEAVVGTHSGGLGDGRFDQGPDAAVGLEPGDQHHRRRSGSVTVHVKSGAVNWNKFVDKSGGSCNRCRRDHGGGRVRTDVGRCDGCRRDRGGGCAGCDGRGRDRSGSCGLRGAGCGATGRVAAPGECERDAQGGGNRSDDRFDVHVSLPVRRRAFRCGRR